MKRYLQTTSSDRNDRKESDLVIEPGMNRMMDAKIDDFLDGFLSI
jgi:hypothetical protein